MIPHDQILPPTDAQMKFAFRISLGLKEVIPADVKADRRALSRWIDRHKPDFDASRPSASGGGATSRQVAYAERIARARRVAIPEECFRSAALMSGWIERHKGR